MVRYSIAVWYRRHRERLSDGRRTAASHEHDAPAREDAANASATCAVGDVWLNCRAPASRRGAGQPRPQRALRMVHEPVLRAHPFERRGAQTPSFRDHASGLRQLVRWMHDFGSAVLSVSKRQVITGVTRQLGSAGLSVFEITQTRYLSPGEGGAAKTTYWTR